MRMSAAARLVNKIAQQALPAMLVTHVSSAPAATIVNNTTTSNICSSMTVPHDTEYQELKVQSMSNLVPKQILMMVVLLQNNPICMTRKI